MKKEEPEKKTKKSPLANLSRSAHLPTYMLLIFKIKLSKEKQKYVV